MTGRIVTFLLLCVNDVYICTGEVNLKDDTCCLVVRFMDRTCLLFLSTVFYYFIEKCDRELHVFTFVAGNKVLYFFIQT